MALRVTENWSGTTLSLKWPFTATREFVVSGTRDEHEALTAVDPTDGTAIPQEDAPHNFAPQRLKCEGPNVKERQGDEYWVITAPYSCPANGSHGPHEEDPLQEPPKISWGTVKESVAVDSDLDQRPLLYTNGLPIPGATRPITYKTLTIVKNFPFYDILLSKQYEMACNLAQANFSGVVTVAAQHMVCTTIGPAVQGYPPDAPFLPIAFEFEVYAENVLGKYPAQHKFLDAHTHGLYASGTNKIQGPFTQRGEPIGDVRLDGTGKPLTQPYGNNAIQVNGSNTATTPFAAVSTYQKEYYDNVGTLQAALAATTAATVLYYKRVRVVDFSPLLSLL